MRTRTTRHLSLESKNNTGIYSQRHRNDKHYCGVNTSVQLEYCFLSLLKLIAVVVVVVVVFVVVAADRKFRIGREIL